MGVVTFVFGLALLTFSKILSYPAAIVPEVQPYATQSIFSSGKISSVTLEIFNPGEIIKGVVERISYPIQADTEVGSVMQYAIITVRGTRQPVISDITSVMTPGISAFGIMRYGA